MHRYSVSLPSGSTFPKRTSLVYICIFPCKFYVKIIIYCSEIGVCSVGTLRTSRRFITNNTPRKKLVVIQLPKNTRTEIPKNGFLAFSDRNRADKYIIIRTHVEMNVTTKRFLHISIETFSLFLNVFHRL